jgi:ketosteroid isomerase-like protein
MLADMKRFPSARSIFIAIAIALSIGACATQQPAKTEDTTKTIAHLTALSDAWDKAIVRKDRVAIESNMADDFRNIDGAGNVGAKKEFVEGLVAADLQIDPYTVEDFDVRLFGDVALLSGHTHMTGHEEGKAFATHYRYIDIYTRRGGEWKIVSVQITRIPK